MNLVTGATGLLGSHIVEKLLARGQPVRALVRAGSDTRVLDGWKVERAVGDVTDPASLAAAVRGVHTVYHAAAQVGDWGPWRRFVATTVRGTANMLAAGREAGVQRFLHVSSISSYGHPDGEGMVLDESAPLGVKLHRWSYYSRAKVEAEERVRAAWDRRELPITIVKPSWLYGPRDRSSMPRLIRAIRAGRARIIGDGTNRLNLTYAGNEAEGCILAATSERAIGQTYNLSNDGEITLQEYLNKIAAHLVRQARRAARAVQGGVLRSVPDGVVWPRLPLEEPAVDHTLRGVADGAAVLLLLRQGQARAGLAGDRGVRRGHPALRAVVSGERPVRMSVQAPAPEG